MNKIVGFIVLAASLIGGEDSTFLVSLGSYCEVAAVLRATHLRKGAFPLDWLMTVDHDGLLALFDEDFQYFLDKEYLFSSPAGPGIIENSRYKIEFKHEGAILEQESLLRQAAEKYQRRIDRFRELRDFRGKVFFIRLAYNSYHAGPTYWLKETPITSAQACALKNALDRYFPHLDFTLIILNYEEDSPLPIEETNGMIEFKIKKINGIGDFKDILAGLVHEEPKTNRQ